MIMSKQLEFVIDEVGHVKKLLENTEAGVVSVLRSVVVNPLNNFEAKMHSLRGIETPQTTPVNVSNQPAIPVKTVTPATNRASAPVPKKENSLEKERLRRERAERERRQQEVLAKMRQQAEKRKARELERQRKAAKEQRQLEAKKLIEAKQELAVLQQTIPATFENFLHSDELTSLRTSFKYAENLLNEGGIGRFDQVLKEVKAEIQTLTTKALVRTRQDTKRQHTVKAIAQVLAQRGAADIKCRLTKPNDPTSSVIFSAVQNGNPMAGIIDLSGKMTIDFGQGRDTIQECDQNIRTFEKAVEKTAGVKLRRIDASAPKNQPPVASCAAVTTSTILEKEGTS